MLTLIKLLHTAVWAFMVARYNKEIFGTLYAGGILFALFTWVRR